MNTWTDEETRELVTLWPTHSAMQIAIRMHRPRAAICAKANRLRRKGLLPDGEKHFDLMHPLHGRPPQILPLPPPPPDDRLAMRPCSLLDLNDRRCIGHSRIRDGCCSAAAQQRRGVVPIAPIICGWRAARTGAELPETMRLAGVAAARCPLLGEQRKTCANFAELAVSGPASMYPAFDWSVWCSGPSWISARVRSR